MPLPGQLAVATDQGGPYYDDEAVPRDDLVNSYQFIGAAPASGYTWNQSVIAVLGGCDDTSGGLPPSGTYMVPGTWITTASFLQYAAVALEHYGTWLTTTIEPLVGKDGSVWSGTAADVFYQLVEKVAAYLTKVGAAITAYFAGPNDPNHQMTAVFPTLLLNFWGLAGTIWNNSARANYQAVWDADPANADSPYSGYTDGHDRSAQIYLANPPFTADGQAADPGSNIMKMVTCGQTMADYVSRQYEAMLPLFDISTVQLDKTAPNVMKDPTPKTTDPNLDNTLKNIDDNLKNLGNGLNGLGTNLKGLGDGLTKGFNGLGTNLDGLGKGLTNGFNGLGNGFNSLGSALFKGPRIGGGFTGIGDLANPGSLGDLFKNLAPGPNLSLDGLGSLAGLGGPGSLSGIGGLNGFGAGGLGGLSGLGSAGGLGSLGGLSTVGPGGLSELFGPTSALGAGPAAADSLLASEGGGPGGTPLYPPPMGGMAGGQQNQDRERTTFLEEDEDVWGARIDLVPPVLGAAPVYRDDRR